MKFRILLCMSLCLTWSGSTAFAQLKLSNVFGDKMVLQRDANVPIWGAAAPREKVTVKFAGQTQTAVANAQGKWTATLDALEVNKKGATLTVSGKGDEIKVTDVLVGDVWFCSGQSNMEWTLAKTKDAKKEIPQTNFPSIRVLTMPNNALAQPSLDIGEGIDWFACSKETASNISGTAYYFGKHVHQNLDVPIGLIVSAWGGSAIEAWLSKEATAALPKDLRKPYPSKNAQHRSHLLYNGMAKPFMPYAIKGVIWYQGETNGKNLEMATNYRVMLPAMITSWREAWGQGDFPFLFVQLPNYKDPSWPVMRESMRIVNQSCPNTGMAVTIDVGETGNIHPRDKESVGNRLGMLARMIAYNEEIVGSGPIFQEMEINGSAVTLQFEHASNGLVSKDQAPLKAFELAGKDQVFHPAQATIAGSDVVVSSELVPKPVAVRYAWAPSPTVNLYNEEGIPASPFRTDDWAIKEAEVVKQPKKEKRGKKKKGSNKNDKKKKNSKQSTKRKQRN